MGPAYFDEATLREVERPVREVLRGVTYRPGWAFSVEYGMVVVRTTVIDANEQSKEIPLTFSAPIPQHALYYKNFDWTRWLFDEVIMRMERHEAQEFFRIDGKPVYDPHPELGETARAA